MPSRQAVQWWLNKKLEERRQRIESAADTVSGAPKEGGLSGYWVSPSGDCIEVIGEHADFVGGRPELFGMEGESDFTPSNVKHVLFAREWAALRLSKIGGVCVIFVSASNYTIGLSAFKKWQRRHDIPMDSEIRFVPLEGGARRGKVRDFLFSSEITASESSLGDLAETGGYYDSSKGRYVNDNAPEIVDPAECPHPPTPRMGTRRRCGESVVLFEVPYDS